VLLGTTDKVNDPNNSDSDTADQEKTCLENLKGKGAAGYLNLLSSFVHNFFDGFGIGVGFASRDPQIIVPIVIAIVAHEIPREMGDVGFLVKNGFSNVQTVLCNGFINFMSLIGVFAGLALGTIGEATQNYVMVFVAGNFMYIGADIWKHLLAHKQFLLNLAEIVMFSLGVGAMFMVLLAEG
jgi:zinc transporter ZupT